MQSDLSNHLHCIDHALPGFLRQAQVERLKPEKAPTIILAKARIQIGCFSQPPSTTTVFNSIPPRKDGSKLGVWAERLGVYDARLVTDYESLPVLGVI